MRLITSVLSKISPVWGVWFVAAVLVWGFVAWDLARSHRQAFHHARIQLGNMVGMYAEEVSSSINSIDYLLIDLREEWKRNPEQFDALVQHRRGYIDPSVAYNVGIIDQQGMLIFSTAAVSPLPVDLSDREHYSFHLSNPADTLYVSKPVILRASYRWAIQFTRPLFDAEGKFNGVIVLSVSPEYFSRLNENINLGKGSAISLAKTDGHLLSRYPEPELALGAVIDDAPWLDAPPLQKGFFEKYSEVDKVERLYAWQVHERGDLTVIMGQSTQTILAPYYQLRATYLWVGAGVTLLLALAAYFLKQYQLQRAKATAEMQLIKETLARSQKLESLGKLTGGVAHDFNNLLHIMGSTIQLLEITTKGDEQTRQHLNSLAETTKRGTKLVSQLLTFARRQPLHPIAVHPPTLLRGIDGLMRRLLGNGIEITTSAPENTWNIEADPALLENVILNLAANARDAMNGHGTIGISVSNERIGGHEATLYPDIEAGEYVLLSVTDTGCGMSAEVMEQAFEPFFTTKPEGKGTGLGLAAAYGFVRESGGHIYIESAPGKGTTIKILLPRSFETVASPSLPEVPSPIPAGGTETILFVEDNPRLRAMTGMMLEHQGYRVLKAADAKEALAILEKGEDIDLLFTDIDMPGGINGIELANKAKSIYPDLTIILASGYDNWDGSTEATEMVQDFPFLNKPYTAQEADAMIKKLLSQKEDESFTA